jgi:23S rRNA pseudouridine1911/1915/1917 synthase
MALKTLETQVSDDSQGRADKVLQTLTGHSRSELRGIFDHQCVHVNGIPCSDPGQMLVVGDHVRVTFDPHTRYREKKSRWSDRTFSVVHDDEDIVVVDKTAGVLTVATERGEPNTLAERVGVYLSHGRKKRVAGIVHRLDREVSGLLVMAKTDQSKTRLVDQFKQHKPQRQYVALVRGTMKSEGGSVRNYLATAKNLDRFATQDQEIGELAVTHYQVRQPLDGATLIDIQLETGRRNQIRVHLADLGHPLLGDSRYGRHSIPHPKWTSKRIALHASTLSFLHPRTGQPVTFRSPLPSVMQRFITATGRKGPANGPPSDSQAAGTNAAE